MASDRFQGPRPLALRQRGPRYAGMSTAFTVTAMFCKQVSHFLFKEKGFEPRALPAPPTPTPHGVTVRWPRHQSGSPQPTGAGQGVDRRGGVGTASPCCILAGMKTPTLGSTQRIWLPALGALNVCYLSSLSPFHQSPSFPQMNFKSYMT